MAFFEKTEIEIKEEMLEKVRTNLSTKGITNFNSGGIMRGFIEIVSYFISLLYAVLNNVFLNAFAKTATGVWLDNKVSDVGITRKKGVKAQVYFTFGRNVIKDSNVKIKAGTIIKTRMNYEGKEFLYKALNETILQANIQEIDVLCEAVEIGSSYNIASGTSIIIVNTISGIDYAVLNDNKVKTYGTDDESDDELRERYFVAWSGLNSGGKDYYKALALEVDGVKEVNVFPVSRGAGTLDLVIVSETGEPSDQLILDVQNKINDNLQFDGIDVDIVKPILVSISLNIDLTVYHLSELESDYITRVTDFLNNRFLQYKVGEDFIASRLKTDLFNSFTNLKNVVLDSGDVVLTDYQLLDISISSISVTVDTEL